MNTLLICGIVYGIGLIVWSILYRNLNDKRTALVVVILWPVVLVNTICMYILGFASKIAKVKQNEQLIAAIESASKEYSM
ncbi:MAG: hypothetical protein WC554_09275 [Clostridia bacterium]